MDCHKDHACFANLNLVAVNRELLGFCPKRNSGFKGSDQRENRGSGVTSTLGTWYGGVAMGVFLSFNEAAIL